VAVITQIPIGFLAHWSGMMERGFPAEVWMFWAFVGSFWLASGVIILRRWKNPTKLDLRFIKYGSVPLYLIIWYGVQIGWHLAGQRKFF
jgi:hypothetical protein